MEMVTLHELSVMFDVSVRVLRSRVRHLVQAGKLIEGQDYHREDFVDENHFVWKISPAAFTRETGLRPVDQPSTTGNQSGNQSPQRITDPLPKGGETLIKPDSPSPGLEREMIGLLKDQLVAKDGQIADLTKQNLAVITLNEKMTHALLLQTEQARKLVDVVLLRLEAPGAVDGSVGQQTTTVNETVNQPAAGGAPTVIHSTTNADRKAA